jgi:hypothetical protein
MTPNNINQENEKKTEQLIESISFLVQIFKQNKNEEDIKTDIIDFNSLNPQSHSSINQIIELSNLISEEKALQQTISKKPEPIKNRFYSFTIRDPTKTLNDTNINEFNK